MSVLLELSGVTKSFGSLRAVDNLSCEINKGEIFGIAGPNGSGKSTLFNVISRIPFASDGGKIVYRGEAIERWSDNRIARAGIIRTFQREAVFASLSCVDNILVAIEQTLGIRGREAEKLADEACDRVGFPKNFHNFPAAGLPVFYQKQLMVAAAVAQKPEILLLDEPASSLVEHEIDWVRETIRKLNGEGMTIMLIEHVLPLLQSVSDRLMVMEQGQKIALGAPFDVIKQKRVIEAYLGGKVA